MLRNCDVPFPANAQDGHLRACTLLRARSVLGAQGQQATGGTSRKLMSGTW